MADLDTGSLPRPNGFEVLRKWCSWTVSPLDSGDGFVQNAVTFSMLVDFQRDGDSICQKVVNANRAVVDGDQTLWNQKMEAANSLTTAQIAAMPKVIALIKEAAKGV